MSKSGQLICDSLAVSIRERLTSPYVQVNYDTATSPYAKFKTADKVIPAREAYAVRSLKQLGSRWGNGEVQRVSTQRSEPVPLTASAPRTEEKAVPAPVSTAAVAKRPISPLRASISP